ncbi:sensor histidine kinase [Candidatus Fonsibacter ubiquis]|uniref:sensor histidine kinase n=1 Tax=Candidatus Fonsibacter ubiquis TaxID=1925548 RepID=UPI000C06F0B0|nr:HAMP domain-containing sensor histidine kinase [Candidatus Fonsibacter ubiquis]
MKRFISLKSLLAKFLFINLFFFSILTLATYSYLQSIEPELVNNKKKEHSKLIKNIALNMELQRTPYKRDNLKSFLANYKYLLPNINQIRIYDSKKQIIADVHSLDINAKPFYKVPEVQEKKLTTDNIPDTSDLTTLQEEKLLNKIISDNLNILGSDKVLTLSKKIKENFIVVSLSSLVLNNENKGFIVITEDSNDIQNAVIERKNFVIRTALSVAAIILIFSIFLNANIIKPIRILGRYTSSASSDHPDNKIINRINLRPDEIGNLSRSLSGMTNNLYKRIEFAERFASDLTHEIRNPLASLKAASELLPNAKDSEKKNRLLGILNDDVVRIERLITDYSNMLKGEALEAKLQLTKFDLIKLINKVAEEYQQVINNTKKNISIEINNLIKKKTFIIGFESRIQQVISNILENSISFSPEKSILKIKIERVKNDAKIIITDEGPGFNESNIGKVFERFYSNRPKEMFGQHSGLGLNIVKNIVESHKGHIKAYNLDGSRGAAIEIDLPIAD